MIKWLLNWFFPTSPARALSTETPVVNYEPKRIKPPSALDVPTPRRRPVRATPAPAPRKESPRPKRREYRDTDTSSDLSSVALGAAAVALFDSSPSYASDDSSSSSAFSGGGGDFGGGGADSSW